MAIKGITFTLGIELSIAGDIVIAADDCRFSHHMNLADGAEAYQLFDSREDGVVKIMIQVDG